jgi:hypothetical protein
MRKQNGIVAIATLLFTLLLQGCGGAAADGQGNTSDSTLSAPSNGTSDTGSSDAVPTLTFTGFSVVEVDGALSGKVVAFFSEDMDASSININTFKVTDASGKPVHGSVLYIGVTGVFTPNQRFDAQASYTATLTTGVRSLNGIPLAKAHTWTFTTPSPSQLTGVLTSITSTQPEANEVNVPLNAGVNVSFHQLMDPATINGSTLTLVDADGDVVHGKVHYSGLSASFVPNGSLEPNTTYKARVAAAASSLSGVPMDADKMWTFTTGTNPGAAAPQVVYTAPMIGDTAVALNATVVVDFGVAMDANSVNTANITLTDSHGRLVEGSVSYTGSTAVFTPSAPLLPQAVYYAAVSGNISSAGGLQMGADYDWSFTTGSFSTAAAPTVVFTSPAPYQRSVATYDNISIAFSEVMDPATLNTGTVQVTDAGGNPVAGTVSYLGNVAFFTPSQTLASGMQYTVTLTSDIKSADGASLTPYSWSFTTQLPM